MEMQRRLALGRLSEIFSRWTFRADRFMRHLDLLGLATREFATYAEPEKRALLSYCRGVNQGARRSWMMRWLGMPITHWTPVDCILWVKMMGFGLAANWEQELLRGQLAAQDPQALAAWGGMTVPAGYPTVSGSVTRERLEELSQEWSRVQDCLPAGLTPALGPGSNAWAISGRLSASGRPMLANDPHLAPKVPDSWFQCELVWPEGQLVGATMAGFPGVVIGQNRHLAWGATNSYIDVQDLFWERIENGRDHAGVALEQRHEEIKVRFLGTRRLTVFSTARGPLLSEPGHGYALSLAWTGFQPGPFFRGLFALNQARNLAEARLALADWPTPSLCYVLADLQDIGYQTVGLIPRRGAGSGLVPVPAWEERFTWRGTLAFEEQPALTNPESGFVVCANHSLGPDLSWDFNSGLRAQRIEQLLAARPTHDWRSFAAIQLDTVSLLACRFRDLCSRLPRRSPWLDELTAWDGSMQADSRPALLYATTLICLAESVLPPAWQPLFLGPATHHPLLRQGGHHSRLQPWLISWLEADPDQRLPRLEEALLQAVGRLKARLGPPHRWRWGRLHWLSLPRGGRLALAGDSDTPNQSGNLCAGGLPGAVNLIASYRMIAELGRPEEQRSCHYPGQSGRWFSPHFADGVRDWIHGVYFRVSQRG